MGGNLCASYLRHRGQFVVGAEVPGLIVHGDDDDLVPIGIPEHLAQRLDDARLEIFSGGGHCRSLNADPDRYLGLLGDLLHDIDGSPVPRLRSVAGPSCVAARAGRATEVPAA